MPYIVSKNMLLTRGERRISAMDGHHLAEVLHVTLELLRLRSTHLNLASLFWAIYLQLATLSTEITKNMQHIGFITTKETAMKYLALMGAAFKLFVQHVSSFHFQ